MKKILIFLIYGILSFNMILAQVPNAFRYQAVVRDASGELIANKMISLRLSILAGSAVGETVYAEVFQYATNEFGIVSLNVGSGSTISGSFSQIDWSSNTYYLQVDIDIDGGENYQFMGTSQILAVPYALQALNVTNKDDADADPANELQTISKTGNTVTLSNNGGSFTDEVNDADADPSNEIQDLSLNNNILVITNNPNATPVSLSAYQGTNTDEQTLSTNIVGNIVELTIGGGTGGNTVSIELPDDFVSRQNGGSFQGNIFAPNLSGVNTGDMSNADVVNAYNTGFPDHFTTVDRVKLDGIEANATGDMTPSEIVTAYQSGYPNYFNNTDRTLLNSIEFGATADMTNTEIVNAYNTGFPEHFATADRTKIDWLGISNTFTVSGGHTVQFNSQGNTILTLPITGTLATESYVQNNFLTANLLDGRILVGESGSAIQLDARGDGQILIGNGNNLFSRPITGDITLSNMGNVTVNSIAGSSISLGGSFSTTTDNIVLNANPAGSNVTLPTSGTLANQAYVDNQVAASNTLNNAQIFVGNASNVATGVSLSGDASISNTGNLTVSSIGGNAVSLGGSFNTGGALTFSGANTVQFTSTAATNVTLPTSGTLANQSYVDNQIAASNTLNNAQIFVGSASNVATGVTLSGDASISNTGNLSVSSIGGNAVSLGGAFNTGGALTFSGANTVQFTSTAATNVTLPTSGTLANQSYVDNQIAASNTLNNAQIFVGNASNVATGVTLSGDASISNTGNLSVSSIGGNAVSLGGAFNTGGALTFSGANTVQFTSTAATNVTLPTSGTLANQSYVDNQIAASNTLNNAQIFVGNASNVATGVTLSGDASISNTGNLSVSSIGGNAVSLGGAFNTGGALTFSGANTVQFTSTAATNVTLPTSGTLANQSYVDNRTGTNITTVGTITAGVWNGTAISGTYLDLSTPGAIGATTANSGAFTTLSASGPANFNGNVNINAVLHLTPMASAPSSPTEGDIYLNSTDNNIYCYINGGWAQLNN